jgi:hypothetical protein
MVFVNLHLLFHYIVQKNYYLIGTLPISKILQTTDIDLPTAVNQVESVVSIFRRLRSNVENKFKQLFLEA